MLKRWINDIVVQLVFWSAKLAGWQELYNGTIADAQEIAVPNWVPHAPGLNWALYACVVAVRNPSEELPVALVITGAQELVAAGYAGLLPIAYLAVIDGKVQVRPSGEITLNLWVYQE